MSTPPKHFYASRRKSKDVEQATETPPSNAEVRSQAIAMLKRAASLPRTPAGRRPPPVDTHGATNPELDENSAQSIPTSETDYEARSNAPVANAPGSPNDMQEMLSPSPVQESFNHAAMYNHYANTPPSAFSMQRSASASSSYHMPSPATMGYSAAGSPYVGNPAAGPHDWAAMQLAASYLPSLSRVGVNQSGYVPTSSTLGRNTPSPLPTLGELRTLQRSNSAMARAHAMNKLTGGSSNGGTAPTSEDGHTPLVTSSLQRADTVGAKMLLSRSRAAAEEEKKEDLEPFVASRPRLQRSFTVSSSNMGEERRSAVGRRMVARLGERRAARQQEEEEVRQLWEERRAAADQRQTPPEDEVADSEEEEHDLGAYQRTDVEDHDDDNDIYHGQNHDHVADRARFEDQEEKFNSDIPLVNRVSRSSTPQLSQRQRNESSDGLGVPNHLERPISGTTMRSEAFEYDNLRRSLSSRTARKELGITDQAMPMVERGSSAEPDYPTEDAEEEIYDVHGIHHTLEAPLALPRPAFATPSRHMAHDSTWSAGTVQGKPSPGESIASRDPLGSMMFIMGGKTEQGNGGAGDAWPTEIGETNGSEWGTPARDQSQPTFDQGSPYTSSPTLHAQAGVPSNSSRHLAPHSPYESTDEPTPPGTSRRASGMSWEEVGGPDDQTVPSDPDYHQKSGSISARLGRNIRTAMRKRSQSRSSTGSVTESGPTSPRSLSVAIQNFSRRGSESSLSPSQASIARSIVRGSPKVQQGNHVRHQPSISSLSPSLPSQPESSANSVLLQHQLSSEASPVGWLPRAELTDPRIHNSKLSPFPGIVQLDRKGDLTPTEPPRLVHQLSDSVVPSQQRVTPEVPGAESIYSLPLPVQSPVESKRASDDSVGKRNWLAKAFGQTSPKIPAGTDHSRQQSFNDLHSILSHHTSSVENSPRLDDDPFAGPPVPVLKPNRHRSASPSVSVVPEVSEEGSRLTRFTAHTRLDNASPAIPEAEERHERELPQKSKEILGRMDDLLSMGPDDLARPDILDDPPRKLLLATQILQVVNIHTAKDRFLFLFNDLLVITKPIINSGVIATLDMRFLVKSIVPLDKLQVSGFEEESTAEPPRHAVVQNFIEQFAQNPIDACRYLVERSNPRVDLVTLASLIFKTPELDRTQIGVLLSNDNDLMRAFIDRFHFSGIRIDDALRMFLLAVRLPTEATAAENLLRGFAHRYFEANRDIISFSRELAEDLVLWIMQLNDTLYGMYGFSLPNHAITLDVVISAFQSKDPHHLVHPSLLSDIYTSLKRSCIDQALTMEEESKYGRRVVLNPSKLPSKLTYNVWSDWVTISIPERDDQFQIRLLGEGLEFEPTILEFGRTKEQRFRVKGSSLGTKSILFDRSGSNAALYAALGNARTFTVERAFMRHTFHVSFTSHTGSKRKYCFSVQDAAIKSKWGSHLQKQIIATTNSKQNRGHTKRDKIRQAAEVVSLQVLRDALIPPEEKEEAVPAANRPPARVQRTGSVSVAYPLQQGKAESDLGPLVSGRPANRGEKVKSLVDVKNGKELVLLCRQNSLLPGVLELLQAGLPDTKEVGVDGTNGGQMKISRGVNGTEMDRGVDKRGARV